MHVQRAFIGDEASLASAELKGWEHRCRASFLQTPYADGTPQGRTCRGPTRRRLTARRGKV
jgi:hypothetical protein